MPKRESEKRPWRADPDSKVWTTQKKVTDPFYYSTRWKHVRDVHKSKYPLCIECEKVGIIKPCEIVDHIIPRQHGGADYDPDNLQSLCKRHHLKKTQLDKTKYKS